MEQDETFKYVLLPLYNQESLESRARKLADNIRAHSEKHDFAKKISFMDIVVQEIEYDGKCKAAVIVPFHRECFRELASLNMYIRERAKETGLEIKNIMLPDGTFLLD